jgi:CO/xanthine dehydrogenase Mo-binding subunit
LANAIFDAIGVRVRSMPFTPDNLMRAIDHNEALNPSIS